MIRAEEVSEPFAGKTVAVRREDMARDIEVLEEMGKAWWWWWCGEGEEGFGARETGAPPVVEEALRGELSGSASPPTPLRPLPALLLPVPLLLLLLLLPDKGAG